MLQGTFETLALPEVLSLLAHSRKTGALWLDAGDVHGSLHLADGRCLAAESGEHAGVVVDRDDLLARTVEVCFAVARQDEGAFRFAADEAPPWTGEPVELLEVMESLEHLLKQWRDVQVRIPSLGRRPRLVEELGAPELIVDRDRWQVLVAIDGRRSVRELVAGLGRPVLDVCLALVALVDAGAVELDEAAVPAGRGFRAPAEAPVSAPVSAPVTAPEPADVAEADSTDDVAEAEDTDDVDETDAATGDAPDALADARDRGAFLRLFSALREA